MILSFLQNSPWLVALLWGLVYVSDYYLTIYNARLTRSFLHERIAYQGSFELTPVFQKDVNALNLFSRAFYWRWILSIALVLLIEYLAGAIDILPFYYFVVGGLFLREFPVHVRHFRIIGTARFARVEGSLRGKIEYSHWFNLKTSAVDLWTFAAFFLLVAIVLGNWFFLGGAFFTFVTAVQHNQLAKRHRKALLPPPALEDVPA